MCGRLQAITRTVAATIEAKLNLTKKKKKNLLSRAVFGGGKGKRGKRLCYRDKKEARGNNYDRRSLLHQTSIVPQDWQHVAAFATQKSPI